MAKFEMGQDLKIQLAKADSLKRDIATARKIIDNGMKQYIKRKIGARNKQQIEDQEAFYADLAGYDSKKDIQDAYGWDLISETEMDRLNAMWDAREIAKQNAGKYSDRITEMLEAAMNSVGERYDQEIFDAEMAKRRFDEDVKRIQRENAQRDWERKYGTTATCSAHCGNEPLASVLMGAKERANTIFEKPKCPNILVRGCDYRE